jgi:hypothetical protein
MRFFSRHSPLYATAAQAKPWQRYACSAIVVGILGYGTLYFSAYLTLVATHYEHEIKAAQQQLEQQQNAAAHIKQLTNTLKDMRYDMRQKALEGKRVSPIAFLLQQARAVNIHIKGCSHVRETVKDWYTKQSLHIELSGSLDALMKFFEKLRTSVCMIRCDHVSVSQMSDGLYACSCTLSMRTLNVSEELVRKQ